MLVCSAELVYWPFGQSNMHCTSILLYTQFLNRQDRKEPNVPKLKRSYIMSSCPNIYSVQFCEKNVEKEKKFDLWHKNSLGIEQKVKSGAKKLLKTLLHPYICTYYQLSEKVVACYGNMGCPVSKEGIETYSKEIIVLLLWTVIALSAKKMNIIQKNKQNSI